MTTEGETRTHRIEITDKTTDAGDVYGVEYTVTTEPDGETSHSYTPVVCDEDALSAVYDADSDRERNREDDESEGKPPLVGPDGSVLVHYFDDDTPEYDDLVVESGSAVVDRLKVDDVEAAISTIDPDNLRRLEEMRVEASGSKLSHREFESYALRYEFGYSRKQVSHLLGIADNTVKVHLRKAREKERDWSERRDESEEEADRWEKTGEFFSAVSA